MVLIDFLGIDGDRVFSFIFNFCYTNIENNYYTNIVRYLVDDINLKS